MPDLVIKTTLFLLQESRAIKRFLSLFQRCHYLLKGRWRFQEHRLHFFVIAGQLTGTIQVRT